jgi:hypothetical protein
VKRRPDEREGWPRKLRRYRPGDWPEGPQAWYDARDAFALANPGLEDDTPPWESNAPDVPWDPELL